MPNYCSSHNNLRLLTKFIAGNLITLPLLWVLSDYLINAQIQQQIEDSNCDLYSLASINITQLHNDSIPSNQHDNLEACLLTFRTLNNFWQNLNINRLIGLTIASSAIHLVIKAMNCIHQSHYLSNCCERLSEYRFIRPLYRYNLMAFELMRMRGITFDRNAPSNFIDNFYLYLNLCLMLSSSATAVLNYFQMYPSLYDGLPTHDEDSITYAETRTIKTASSLLFFCITMSASMVLATITDNRLYHYLVEGDLNRSQRSNSDTRWPYDSLESDSSTFTRRFNFCQQLRYAYQGICNWFSHSEDDPSNYHSPSPHE